MTSQAKNRPVSIDAYLAAVPEIHRAVLQNLRSQIQKLYPAATEHISYGMPLFKLEGRAMAGFRAAKQHSSLFVWSSTALGKVGSLLKGYDIAQGTVRFPPDKALPFRLVRAILAARAGEIQSHSQRRTKKKV